jgi:hypothetical protein
LSDNGNCPAYFLDVVLLYNSTVSTEVDAAMLGNPQPSAWSPGIS